MGEFIGAVDQGTTSTRFIVFDVHGNIVSHAQKEHGQIYPKPGWVEHDPMEIIANTNEVIGAALARANLTAADLDSVGMTNQRETTLLWDRKTGKPLYSAIVWMDTRADEIVRRFTAQGGQDCFRRQTGLPLATYFSAVKLCWMFENIPGARRKAEAGDVCFGTMDSWLAWHLTRGQHVTDVTNASRTMLMNLSTCAWDDDLLAAFDIPPKCLPRIVASSGDIGRIRTAPLGGVRLTSMLGDQQAALVGQTCFAPGEAKSTYGTGAFMLMHTGAEPVHSKAGLLTTVAYQFGQAKPCYALEGSIAITGALVQWLRDNLRMIDHASEIEKLAISVENNGGVYIVPAFSGLYAPYWKDSARGVIAGLTRYATRAHFARAALEATAFQVCDVAHAMEEDSGIKLSSLKTDGGMVGNNLLMQFQADMLGVPVVRSKIAEITALGAAYAAGLATGFWPGTETLKQNWEAGKSWQPAMAAADRAEHARLW